MSCGVGHRRGLDPALLCLWCRPAAAAQIRPLAWDPPYATGAALQKTTTTTKDITRFETGSDSQVYNLVTVLGFPCYPSKLLHSSSLKTTHICGLTVLLVRSPGWLNRFLCSGIYWAGGVGWWNSNGEALRTHSFRMSHNQVPRGWRRDRSPPPRLCGCSWGRPSAPGGLTSARAHLRIPAFFLRISLASGWRKRSSFKQPSD